MRDEYDDVGDDVGNAHQQPHERKAGGVIGQEIHGAGEKVTLDND